MRKRLTKMFGRFGCSTRLTTWACAPLAHLWLWQQGTSATPSPSPVQTASPTQSPEATAPLSQPCGGDVLDRLLCYINKPLTIGNTLRISLASLTIGLIILLAALVVSRLLRRFVERRLAEHPRLDPGVQFTVLRLVHYLILTVGFLFAFKTAFNADLTTLAVVFTALSVGIGFGLQFIAGDLASGFILLFERPLRVGDFIATTGPDSKITEGRVTSINLRTTIVQTNDHISVIVPNSKLVNQNLINWSYGGKRSRISVPVGVAYDSDVEVVTRTLLRAAEGVNYVLPEPKPSVQFLAFGESSLDFRLLVWTDRPRRYPQIKSDINYNIRRLFLEQKIEVPYAQRDINLRDGAIKVELQQDSAAALQGQDAPAAPDSRGFGG